MSAGKRPSANPPSGAAGRWTSNASRTPSRIGTMTSCETTTPYTSLCRDHGQLDVRRVLGVDVHRLLGHDLVRVAAHRLTGVRVDVEPGPVRGGDVDADPVA